MLQKVKCSTCEVRIDHRSRCIVRRCWEAAAVDWCCGSFIHWSNRYTSRREQINTKMTRLVCLLLRHIGEHLSGVLFNWELLVVVALALPADWFRCRQMDAWWLRNGVDEKFRFMVKNGVTCDGKELVQMWLTWTQSAVGWRIAEMIVLLVPKLTVLCWCCGRVLAVRQRKRVGERRWMARSVGQWRRGCKQEDNWVNDQWSERQVWDSQTRTSRWKLSANWPWK